VYISLQIVDRFSNPYTPGAGSRPKELAGRDAEISQFDTLLGRLERGNPERSMIVSGLRGVGKTVLLNEFEERADARGWGYASLEARANELDVRDEVARMAQNALVEISLKHKAKESLRKVARILKAFTITANESGELEGSFDLATAFSGPEGSLEHDLVHLFQELGRAAADHDTGVVFFIDEMQLIPRPELEAIIAAVHRAGQRNLPIAIVGAGLPVLPGKLAEAKSYAERLFAYPHLGPLPAPAARRALERPAEIAIPDRSVRFEPDAVEAVLAFSEGYPVFLQAHGKHAWNLAPEGNVISLDDVERARPDALAELDRELFLSRVQRATPRERIYLAAMAGLGDGPQRTGEVARRAGYKTTQQVGVLRQGLLDKGLIYAPDHGKVAYTVPHFGDFMRRTHPLESLLNSER
jgi:hypothetical protein